MNKSKDYDRVSNISDGPLFPALRTRVVSVERGAAHLDHLAVEAGLVASPPPPVHLQTIFHQPGLLQ